MMQTLQKITWKQLFKSITPNWSLNPFSKKKTLLAFEFGIVLSNVAKQLNIEVTPEIVAQAEKILEKELIYRSSQQFACNMNVYILAVLEPKEV